MGPISDSAFSFKERERERERELTAPFIGHKYARKLGVAVVRLFTVLSFGHNETSMAAGLLCTLDPERLANGVGVLGTSLLWEDPVRKESPTRAEPLLELELQSVWVLQKCHPDLAPSCHSLVL